MPQPTHRNDWRVTVALFATVGIVESFAFGHLGAFTPLYLDQLGVAADQIPRWTGLLSAVGFVLGVPLLPFWGVWADRYSRKLVIVRSSFAGALMFALAALSQNAWQLAGARLLSGFVLGNTGVMLAVQAEISPRDRLASAIALITAGPPLGIAIGPLFGGAIVQRYGVPTLLMIDAAMTLGVAIMLIVVLREEPRTRRTDVSTGRMLHESLSNIINTPLIRRLFGIGFVVLLGLALAQPFVPIRIEQLFGKRPNLPLIIGALASVSGLTMALCTPLWGRLSDRIGHSVVLRIGIISTAAMLGAQALGSSLGWFTLGRIGQGMVQGSVEATITALVALYAPTDRRAAILNLSRLPAQLSWFLGPLIGAGLSVLGIPAIFGISAACTLLGFWGAMRLPDTRVAQPEWSVERSATPPTRGS